MPKSRQFSLPQRVRYWFDNWMSRGTASVIALLAIGAVIFSILGGLVVWAVSRAVTPVGQVPEHGAAPWNYLWNTLMKTLFPGGIDDGEAWWYRALMLVGAVGGILTVAALIGIVSGAIRGKIESLRHGRSAVIENRHTLILGWSPKVTTIVEQLIEANASRRNAVIVVVSERDKVEMEADLRAAICDYRTTKVVCRTGDPKKARDAELGSPHTARSIIIVGPADVDDPDTHVIKSVMALRNAELIGKQTCSIVGEIRETANLAIAELAGGDGVQWVNSTNLVGQILLQTCRQTGLSSVYAELLDFQGQEIYPYASAGLEGRTYYEAQLMFPNCTVIGVSFVYAGVLLNPPADYVIGKDEKVIVIAEDDSRISYGSPVAVDSSNIAIAERKPPVPEQTLVLGSNENLPRMLRDLNAYVAAGSRAVVVTNGSPRIKEFERLSVEVLKADPALRETLEGLDLSLYDHVVVLPEGDLHAADIADNRVLMTLLHLRDLSSGKEYKYNLVSEVIDEANMELAAVSRTDDFVISSKLVALALAQVSENPRLKLVYDDLFDTTGIDIFLRPISEYVRAGVEIAWPTLLEAARRRGETAIGYRDSRYLYNATHGHGVVVNPAKSMRRNFRTDDCLIVIAGERTGAWSPALGLPLDVSDDDDPGVEYHL